MITPDQIANAGVRFRRFTIKTLPLTAFGFVFLGKYDIALYMICFHLSVLADYVLEKLKDDE